MFEKKDIFEIPSGPKKESADVFQTCTFNQINIYCHVQKVPT